MPSSFGASDLRFETLGPRHDRDGFSCGIEALDNYLRRQARQDFKKRVSVAFVLTPDGITIAGYYTLSQYSVLLEEVPAEVARRLPRYPQVPATLLGRLAVHTRFRGRRLGELLLMDALKRALDGSRQVASAAVVVDAKNDAARAFYLRYGFLELPSRPDRLFLPMATIEQLFQ